ncbi:hypothetical protein AB4027_11530 [Alkalibacterium putridalgicola]|uniref:hypothetical protein n=1 Tax=Alkalibacterium putridalgicola TaxID=426703 RepID=UPI0034D0024C
MKYIIKKEAATQYELKSTSLLAELDKFIGRIIGIPFSIRISNCTSDDELMLKRKFSFAFPKYEVSNNGEYIASINTQRAMTIPKVTVNSIYGDFVVETNAKADYFDILKGRTTVASVKRGQSSLSDQYEITNYDNTDTDFLVAIICSLDNIF